MSTTPIVLSDSILNEMLNTPAVLRAFPQMADYAQNLKHVQKLCRTCGAQHQTMVHAFDQVRQFVLDMPPESIALLKASKGLPADRPFLSYRLVNGKTQRILK
jgi:hypothetical protein